MKLMRLVLSIILALFCWMPTIAQMPKPAAKAPAIPDALQARFWKAQAEFKTAQEALQHAQAENQAVIEEIQKVCGFDFQPQMDAKGDPACVAKPKK